MRLFVVYIDDGGASGWNMSLEQLEADLTQGRLDLEGFQHHAALSKDLVLLEDLKGSQPGDVFDFRLGWVFRLRD